MEPESTRCGFVAVIGAPNAGKSTLVNRLVGTKVSIVSRKVQTTRSIVRGIAIAGRSQIVFVDDQQRVAWSDVSVGIHVVGIVRILPRR